MVGTKPTVGTVPASAQRISISARASRSAGIDDQALSSFEAQGASVRFSVCLELVPRGAVSSADKAAGAVGTADGILEAADVVKFLAYARYL